MTTTRFITYKCNLCKRTVDEENRLNTVKFTKCNITLGCEGKLYPIGSKNTRNIVATSAAIEPLTEDWMPREEVAAKSAAVPQAEILPISLITGNNAQLTIAVPTSSTTTSSLTAVVKKRQVDASTFSAFTFSRGGTVAFISGRDNSVDSKTLSFDISDTIEVFVNTVKLNTALWSIDAAAQAVLFSPSLVGETLQIKINVTKTVATPTYNLTFNYNSFLVNSSWGNVSEIKLFGVSYALYTTNDLSSVLKIGEELQFISLEDEYGEMPLTNSAYILLAYSPYSPIDRELTSVIQFSNITSEWLSAPISEKLNLTLAARIEKPVWPEISTTLLINPSAERNQLSGSSETVEKAINPYLLGPI